jgi:transposase-like protein
MNASRKPRKNYTPAEKVALLRRHLVDKVPVSDLCDEQQLNVNVFYTWQRLFFENGAAAFERTGKNRRNDDAKDRRIAQLEAKLAQKHEVISELMSSPRTSRNSSASAA